jgi:hypothetical protein
MKFFLLFIWPLVRTGPLGKRLWFYVEVREASLQGTFYYLRASDCMESN